MNTSSGPAPPGAAGQAGEVLSGRERVQRALAFQPTDRVPRDLWALPGIAMHRRDELAAVKARFPPDIAAPDVAYGRSLAERGVPSVVGAYTDAWGCVWRVTRKASSAK